MKVAFTMRARVELVPLLAAIRGKVTDDSRLLARGILRKIDIKPEESAKYETDLGDGRVARNNILLDGMPPHVAEINDSEATKLSNMINEGVWDPRADDWFEPLLEQLRVAARG
jgi:hypothetical protein